MGNISKIKVQGTAHNIKDAILESRVNEIDEITAAAFNDVNEKALNNTNRISTIETGLNLTELTDDELTLIFSEVVHPTIIYTENFDGFTIEEWGDELGMSVAEIMASYPDSAASYGSQKFTNSGETFEYDGTTYELWALFVGDGDTGWGDSGMYGLLPSDASVVQLEALKADQPGAVSPFIGKVQSDEFYGEPSEGEWLVMYVE